MTAVGDMPDLSRDVVAVGSCHAIRLSLNARFWPQNGHSKPDFERILWLFCRLINGIAWSDPICPRHQGGLATIGRKAAVVDFGWVRLHGAAAWWLWGLVHVFFLLGMRNRISVMWDWFWAYLTYRSGTRLITGAPGASSASPPLAPP